jgi:TonB family protein
MTAHAVVFYAAAIATMPRGTDESAVTKDMSIIYVRPQAQRAPEPTPPIRSETFRTLLPPIRIPGSIPAIDLNQTWDPGDYTGVGTELGPGQGVEGPVDPTGVFIESLVDEPPVRISFPQPEYPRPLLEARIEGSVVLEAVIDTLGHPEPGSIQVVSSTNRGFDGAARAALQRALFRAARTQGQRVRVLVRQSLRFQLLK